MPGARRDALHLATELVSVAGCLTATRRAAMAARPTELVSVDKCLTATCRAAMAVRPTELASVAGCLIEFVQARFDRECGRQASSHRDELGEDDVAVGRSL